MKIDTYWLVSMTEANQNFSRVARLVSENGSAVILKNNHPRYLILDFQKLNETAEDACALTARGISVTLEEEGPAHAQNI